MVEKVLYALANHHATSCCLGDLLCIDPHDFQRFQHAQIAGLVDVPLMPYRISTALMPAMILVASRRQSRQQVEC